MPVPCQCKRAILEGFRDQAFDQFARDVRIGQLTILSIARWDDRSPGNDDSQQLSTQRALGFTRASVGGRWSIQR